MPGFLFFHLFAGVILSLVSFCFVCQFKMLNDVNHSSSFMLLMCMT